MDVLLVLWRDSVKIPQQINKHIRIKSTPFSQRATKTVALVLFLCGILWKDVL